LAVAVPVRERPIVIELPPGTIRSLKDLNVVSLMAFICAEFAVEYLRLFVERIVSTFETSLASVPVPLKRRTGTADHMAAVAVGAVVVDPAVVDPVVVDPVVVDPVVVDPAVVDPAVVDPAVVDPVVVDPVVVDPAVVDPVVVDPVVVDPAVVDPVVVDPGNGTGAALAGFPIADPCVPHAVKAMGIRTANPKIATRFSFSAEIENETTGPS
jgi:hypothetical protein